MLIVSKICFLLTRSKICFLLTVSKIIITTLECFVTSFPHVNNWHVFPRCLFYKKLTHKLSNYVTYYLNEQIQDVFTTHFFWEKEWSQIEIFFNFFYMNWFSVIFQIDFYRKIIAQFYHVLWYPVLIKMIGMSFQNVYSRKT